MADEDDVRWLEDNGFVPVGDTVYDLYKTDWKRYIGGDLLVVYGRSDEWRCIASCMGSTLYANAKDAKGAISRVARMWREKAAERKSRLEAQIEGLDVLLEADRKEDADE